MNKRKELYDSVYAVLRAEFGYRLPEIRDIIDNEGDYWKVCVLCAVMADGWRCWGRGPLLHNAIDELKKQIRDYIKLKDSEKK